MKNYIRGAIAILGLGLIVFFISTVSSADLGPCRTESDYARLKNQISVGSNALKSLPPTDDSVAAESDEWYDRKTEELTSQIAEIQSMIDDYSQLNLCRQQINPVALPRQPELESNLIISDVEKQIEQLQLQILSDLI